MPANFCLMPETVTKFKQALKDGTIDPEKMANMSSADRNAFLSDIVGKNHAQAVNSLFESKILLKNQKKGYLTWAKTVSGIKPAARRDMISRIERMQKVLDPEEGKQFMQDLTATRLGVNVSEDEARKIADLSKSVSDAESFRSPDGKFPSEDARFKYGYAVEDLTDYVASLKQSADKLRFADLKSFPKNPGLLGKFTSKTAGNLKSIQASMDDSAIFRQGWKVMFTDSKIWAKNAVKTFTNAAREFKGENVLRHVNADIISRPNYDRYIKAKLAIKNPEEAFPESLAEKVPVLRRLYKASETAFTAFQYKNRVDVFDKYLQIAEKNGVNINDPDELKSIGKLVNSLTGRGDLGKLEPVANTVNNVFFSPRFVKGNIDTLTAHQFQKGITPFVRKKAATNLAKIIGGTATILTTADALYPGSVEFDPRSSDFGKIRVGDTRFDVTGGMGSILTLAARLITEQSKSASTGKIQSYNTGKFGDPTSIDAIKDFLVNKASPAFNTGYKLATGTDFSGKKVGRGQTLIDSVTPIGIQTGVEAVNDPNSAGLLATMIADGLGLSANAYSASGNKNGTSTWDNSSSKELAAFKQVVGEEKYKQAGADFDRSYNEWMSKMMTDPEYKNLSSDEKSSLINKKKSTLKKDILALNGFKYKQPKRTNTSSSLLNK